MSALFCYTKFCPSYQRFSHVKKKKSDPGHMFVRSFSLFWSIEHLSKISRHLFLKHPVSCANTAEYCFCEEYFGTAVRGYASRVQ